MNRVAYRAGVLVLTAAGIAVTAFGACTAAETNPSDDDASGAAGATSSSGATGGAGGTTSSSSSSSTTSTGGEGGTPWLECSVPYSSFTGGECDLLNQNCPAGQWCKVSHVDGGWMPVCVPGSGGLKTKGMTCTATPECVDGLQCLGDHCSPVCCQATHEPCEGGLCDMRVTVGGGWFSACSYQPSCRLFLRECAPDTYCHIADQDQGLAVCDSPSGPLHLEGEECQYRNDCGESQVCRADTGGSKRHCRHLCDLTLFDADGGVPDGGVPPPGEGGCLPDRVCRVYDFGAFVDVGMCVPP